MKKRSLGAVSTALALFIAATLAVSGASSGDRYQELKEKRMALLRSEDCLKRDILELELDIDELVKKLKKKTNDLETKRWKLGRLQLDIRDCEKDIAAATRTY